MGCPCRFHQQNGTETSALASILTPHSQLPIRGERGSERRREKRDGEREIFSFQTSDSAREGVLVFASTSEQRHSNLLLPSLTGSPPSAPLSYPLYRPPLPRITSLQMASSHFPSCQSLHPLHIDHLPPLSFLQNPLPPSFPLPYFLPTDSTFPLPSLTFAPNSTPQICLMLSPPNVTL